MAKPDTKENKEARETAPATAASAPALETASAGGKASFVKAWLPVIATVLLAPAASFAVAEFLLLPRLQARLGATPAELAAKVAATEAKPESGAKGKGDGKGDDGGGNFEFTNVVVNLAGTMGTRYLKVSFIVTGIGGKGVKNIFDQEKAKLTDVTLNVLSSLTLADLEEPGAKNVLREKLVATYNQVLGKRVVEQVYFSDFVIQ